MSATIDDGGAPLRVVVADDAALLRDGIVRILRYGGFEFVDAVGDAVALLDVVRRARPDLVVVDIRMPPTHTTEGLEAGATIRSELPSTGIMVLSQYVEPRYAVELLRTDAPGGIGYLLKDSVTDIVSFLRAARHVAHGGSAIDPAVVAQLLDRPRSASPIDTLTERERQVLARMAEGASNNAIAATLHISPRTLEKHVTSVFQKLGIFDQPDQHRRVLAVISYLRRPVS